MNIQSTQKYTSKERVLAAINHQETDRVPANYYANPTVEGRLKDFLGIKPDDKEGLLRRLGVDFRLVHHPYKGPRLHAEIPGVNVDPEWGVQTRWAANDSGGYWDFCGFPLKDMTIDQAESWPMPHPDDYDYDLMLDHCRLYPGYCVVFGNAGIGDIMNGTGALCGMEEIYAGLATKDEALLRWIDRKIEVTLEVCARALEKAKGCFDLFWMGEDLGSQNRPLISLRTYRELIRPRHQKFIDLAKSFGLPVMIHSCGSSSWAFEDFIDMGIKVVDTLQPEATNMAPAYLKSHYGERLAFHGCISTAALAKGQPQDIAQIVHETLEIMKPGGGYMLTPTHLIQDNTPVENILAMYDAQR